MDGLMTRSRASDFDAALDADPAGAPSTDAELRLAHRLRHTGDALAPVPTAEFREALRTRLMAVAAVQGVGAAAVSPSPAPAAVSWRTRAATVTAGIMATVVAAGGVAVASSRSLPGDPFYGVKRTTEGLQLRVAGDDQAEGTRHLEFAATRLREVRALVLGRDAPADAVARGPVAADVEGDVRGALADMDEDTRTGLALLMSSFRADRETAPLEELSRFAVAQDAGLRSVLPALSGPGRAQAQESLVLVESVRAEADELLMLVDCTAVCDPSQVAPSVPAVPGAPAAPCSCPTTVPPPQTAPPPPVSQTPPATGEPAPPTEPGTSAPPATPPSEQPPPPSQEPEPGPGLPGLPGLPGPSLPTPPPLPTPSVELPALPLDGLLPGIAPAVLPVRGWRALTSWLLGR